MPSHKSLLAPYRRWTLALLGWQSIGAVIPAQAGIFWKRDDMRGDPGFRRDDVGLDYALPDLQIFDV